MKSRIVIADDHKLFLEGMEKFLSSSDETEVIAKASNGREAIEKIRKLRPDIAVVDITMPEVNGIDVTKTIKKEFPAIKILILSMHLDRRMILEVLKAGADGYALKESEPDELILAVRIVMSGEIYLSPKVTSLLIKDYIQKLSITDSPEKLNILSAREREVLSLISEGRNAKFISEKLCISRSTVDVHRRNLMLKLECENLNELTRFAMREGWVNIDE
ncbi:MAG: response regulator transcription factor [Synergistaceae bacterium]|nr:response regulator transcription factor [Synergistaceae bacterium]